MIQKVFVVIELIHVARQLLHWQPPSITLCSL